MNVNPCFFCQQLQNETFEIKAKMIGCGKKKCLILWEKKEDKWFLNKIESKWMDERSSTDVLKISNDIPTSETDLLTLVFLSRFQSVQPEG